MANLNRTGVSMSSKVGLYLIHNNDSSRLDLRKLIFDFGNSHGLINNECHTQAHYTVPSPIRRRLDNITNEVNRIYYSIFLYRIKSTRKTLWLVAIIKVIRLVVNCIFEARKDSLFRHKRLTIESYVTNKHISAWNCSLAAGDKYLVVFEDDAVILQNSSETFSEALKVINIKHEHDNLIYADLAGGFPSTFILETISASIESYSALKYYLSRDLRSNTACCYLMSQELVTLFLDILSKQHHLSTLPIDHLINHLGMCVSESLLCIHCLPTVFKHGSFTGQVSSWQTSA